MAYLKGVNLSASSNIDGTAANFTSISGSSLSGSFTGSFIGNIVGTSSLATVANIANTSLTASYVGGGSVDGTVLSATSASFATSGDGNFTGSFTGSFTGDGSNLTGVTAAGTLSSSAQIASDISGAFTAPSASFSTRVTAQETFSSSLDATFATEAELNSATASLSSSLSADISTNKSDITTNSASAASSIAANVASIITNSASAASDIAGLVADSASFSTRVTSQETFSSSLSTTTITYTGSFTGDGSGLTGVVAAGTISSSAQIASDISGAFTSTSASIATDIATLDGSAVKITGNQSIAGTKTFTEDIAVQGTASINYLKTIYETSSVIFSSGSTKFGDTLDDTHIRTGSLLVTGSSYKINGEDIIITSVLNTATASLSSSLATNIATKADSASFASSIAANVASITTNSSSVASDVAGLVADSASFSTRITTAESELSNTLLSSSAQIASDISGAFTSTSASIAASIGGNVADITTLTSKTGSYATTGSNTFIGNQTITGSVNITGSVTSYGFNLDPSLTGIPALFSPTSLNLSASDAVVVTSSPFRVASLTTTERGTFTAQNGDVIFNTTVGKYQVYSGSAWTNVLQTEDKYDEIIVTVVSDGGNKYAFDGVTAPKLSLNKGTTYRFDLSDSTNNNHPLAFRLPDNTSYTTGVTTVGTAGNTGAYVEFDVDFATSSSLKYYCTVHGNGMGNTIQLIDLYDLVATGSLQGTATTASYVTTAQTASYVAASNVDGTVTSASYAITSSHAITASFAENAGSVNTGSLLTTASATSNTITFTKGDSSTFAVTVATGSGGGTGTGFPFTGSAGISGSLTVVGGTISGDGSGLTGVTASISTETTVTSSFTNSVSETVTHNFNSLNVNVIVYDSSNTQIIPESVTLSSANVATVTFAATSSGHIVVTEGGHLISHLNGSGGAITASGHLVPSQNETYDLGSSSLRWKDLYLSGSTINLGGTEISRDADGHVSFHVGSTRKKIIVDELIIGSDTSSQRRVSVHSGRLRVQTDGGSEALVLSSSYAITASYAENAGGGSGFPFTGSADISGSLNVTGSVSFPRFDSTAGTAVFSSADTLNQSKSSPGGAGASSTAGIVFGGYVGPSYSNCTEEYNGTSYSAGGNIITARQQMKGAGTSTAAIGTGGNTPSIISDTEEYDGTSWATGGAMINTRKNHAAGGTQNAGLAYGGYGTSNFMTATEEYDGSSWSSGGALIVGRAAHGGAGTQNSSLLIGGRGPGYSNSYFNCTEEYDGSSWTVGTNTINISYWRGAAAASANAYLAGHGAGASGTPTVISSGETWDGSSWSSAGSFIQSRNQVAGFGNSTSAVFAGGFYPSRFNCTEEFSPPGSYIPGFVYDKDTGTTTSTTFVESSALRYKEDIQPLNPQLDKVMQLKPVSYTWSPTQDQHIGLVAEEVNKLYPEFIGHNQKGEVEGIQYSKMVSILIQSIQEQQEQINELKNIIKENK